MLLSLVVLAMMIALVVKFGVGVESMLVVLVPAVGLCAEEAQPRLSHRIL